MFNLPLPQGESRPWVESFLRGPVEGIGYICFLFLEQQVILVWHLEKWRNTSYETNLSKKWLDLNKNIKRTGSQVLYRDDMETVNFQWLSFGECCPGDLSQFTCSVLGTASSKCYVDTFSAPYLVAFIHGSRLYVDGLHESSGPLTKDPLLLLSFVHCNKTFQEEGSLFLT